MLTAKLFTCFMLIFPFDMNFMLSLEMSTFHVAVQNLLVLSYIIPILKVNCNMLSLISIVKGEEGNSLFAEAFPI